MAIAVLEESDIQTIIRDAVKLATAELRDELGRSRSPILTKAQVAAYLDKPISTINRWMKEGLPYRKDGSGYPEFYRPHIDRWIDERFQKMEGQTNHGSRQKLVKGNVVRLEAA